MATNELAFYYVTGRDDNSIEQQIKQILEEALQQANLKSHISLKMKRVKSIPRDDRSGKFKLIKSLGVPSDLSTTFDTSIP